MPKSINKVILVGNVGADPEVKYTLSGIPVGKFSVATNERFKNKSGEWQDRTEWHNIVAWQKLAEIVGEYVSKGSKVYIEGKLRTSSWEDRRSGEQKYRTEIVARDLVLLGLRENGSVRLTLPGLAKSRTKISHSKTDLPERGGSETYRTGESHEPCKWTRKWRCSQSAQSNHGTSCGKGAGYARDATCLSEG